MLILRVVEAFAEHGVAYAIAGGYAVALHGAIRGTVDIDVVIALTERQFILAEKALGSIGLKSRIPVNAQELFRFRNEYIKNRNLLAWSFENPDRPIEIVDVLLHVDLRKIQTTRRKFRKNVLKIVSLKDLIKMKTKTGRAQDEADVSALRQILNEGSGKKK
jgi:hypothetical protein